MLGFKRINPKATSEQTAWDKDFNKLRSVSLPLQAFWFAALYGPVFAFFISIFNKSNLMKTEVSSILKIEIGKQIITDVTLMIALALVVIAIGLAIFTNLEDAKKNLGDRPTIAA